MEVRSERIINLKALIVHNSASHVGVVNDSIATLLKELNIKGITTILADSADDAAAVLHNDATIELVLLDWVMSDDEQHNESAKKVIHSLRSKSQAVPLFLLLDNRQGENLTHEIMRETDELIWIQEDTPYFLAGRVHSAILSYREKIVPPLTRAIFEFAQKYEYSWHTPGHAGGTAFMKSAVGRAFHDYFGENLLRSDLSISVGELGSLLDHSGPIGESEKFCARVFGADRAYTVTNGSSMSNRVIMMSSVARGDYALCDRNAHKSTEQALTMTGVVPTYLMPSRNYLGIIGPVYANTLSEHEIKQAIAHNPLAKDKNQKALHAIITNSTYDGLTYHVPTVVKQLDASVDRIHFDEAWYGYARFNPLYADRFGMYGEPEDYPRDLPTIFTTTSTHKLLAALSQASLIGVRDGRNPVPHSRFNESYMMHASTSPLYPIIMANEVSAEMMRGQSGKFLTTESITEAVRFRKAVRRIRRDLQENTDWFFSTWNADFVTDPETGKKVSFEDAPISLLVSDPRCWELRAGDEWHGFRGIEDGYCMLDPIKVSVVMPGVATDGSLEETGIPATLVTAFLSQRGIQVEKTTDFTILFLFSLGITKGKYGTLINALLKFKDAYDGNIPVEQVLYPHENACPVEYKGKGLKTLADEMFAFFKETGFTHVQAEAFTTLPEPVMTPAEAYVKLVHNDIEIVSVDNLYDRILATGVVPYPPGIPMIMPGESAGGKSSPYIRYLQILQQWDQRFPGFGHDIHGVENEDGTYYVQCLKSSK
ncbi:Orn/Lys/Arg decarboxylase N-terminal domain-containing protein [Scandinavium sp. V105_16]|uniref:Orn/Lys/Arg decarboxylase N-terminal domain-containing protein n=1 Tax=Scandinavium lactucae TaxID=3095028 RepID=A0AAJ2VU05_9ENTR|nr:MULTISPECIES: Orn/Lys/Arg decarboxylase N-terminal domain-containing protein [unclassified Scandinavium]MDX6020372.1 Orn/Lys/Arg decarboxylase N-terminal domain-containing protein [Scandinavium sp. V105_16]MDX6031393.1 Orn/Lys/Arg decarboxylase N-terminal domain-containing protein [Scandinavium sp. V105_12]